MRKILLCLLVFCFSFLIQNNAKATHIMGGEITWVCNSQGQYIFTFKTYRDCGGVNGGPNNSFAIQNWPMPGNNTPLTEDVSQRSDRFIGPSCRPSDPNFQSFSCASGDDEVVQEFTRVMQPITLTGTPPPAGWIVTYTQAARNANDNLLGASVPNAHDITLRAYIFPHSGTIAGQCVDNSPQFREEATSLLCTGSTFTYNHNATDRDLDSLVYSWARPLDGFTGPTYNEGVDPAFIGFEPGFTFDAAFPGPESLNAATGEITLNPPSGGKFVSAVQVTAYKCGERVAEVYRELQSVISNNCQANQTKPTIDAPFMDGNGNFIFEDTVRAGDLVTFTLAARDLASIDLTVIPPFLGDSVFLTATGQQFGTNFTSTTGCDNPPCATLGSAPPIKGVAGASTVFTWQTDCNHVSFTDRCISDQNTYTFVITATDDDCPIPSINISTISITVVGDTVIDSPSLNCVDVQANGDVSLDWNLTPNINNSFTGWMIYSGTDRNGPFSLIDSVLTYNQSTYTHVGANADSQQRFYHVRSRSGCKGRIINVAADTVSTIFLSASNSATDVTVNWTALDNPNPAGSSSNYRVFREYPVGSGFNLHQTIPSLSTSLTETFTVCEDTVTYRVELENTANGCTSSSQILGYRFEFAQPQTNFTFVDNQCPGDLIAFTNQTTIAGGTMTFAWDFGDGVGTSTQQNPSYTYTAPGTYIVTLTATSDKGCDSTLTRSIQITLPTADAGTDQAICPGGNVTIGGSPTTTGGNTILWSPATGLSNTSAANPVASPSTTTTYTVTVTDGNGCTATDQVVVTVNPIPTANAGMDQTTCPGIGVSIGGTPTGPGGATFAWSPVSGLDDASAANPTASPIVTTTYTVTVTSGVNCSATDQVTVTVNPNPDADAGLDQTICLNESVTIGGAPTSTTGGASFAWDNAGSLDNAGASNPSANPTATTTYTVTVTHPNGCTATDQVTVNVNSLPVVDAGADQFLCSGGSVTIGGSPTGPVGSSFVWSPATGLTSTSVANPSANPTATTTYTVTVTDGNGCTATDMVTVNVGMLPVADAGLDQTICATNSAVLGGAPTGPAGSSFVWDNAGTLDNAMLANPTATPSSTTTYTVTVTDASGCSQTDAVTITVDPLPTVDAGADIAICTGNSVMIGGSPTSTTGGASFAWDNAGTLDNVMLANPTATPTVTTTYTVTVTHPNGCTATDQIVVTVNNLPTADAGMDQTICDGGNTTIGGSPTGVAGSTFAWSPVSGLDDASAANPVANPTVTTTYTVTVTSGVNCTNTDQVTVTVNPNPDADAGLDQTICLNESVTIGGSPTSTTGGASFAWDNAGSLDNAGASNPSANPTATTTYTVTVTHPNGCTATDQVTVNVNSLPVVDAGADVDICIGGSIQIGGSPTGPAGSSFVWDNAGTLDNAMLANPSANPLVTTTYTVTVTDANGCTNTDNIVVTVNPLPIVDAGMDQTICNGESTAIGGTPTGPTGSGFVWDNAGTLDNANAANPQASPLVTTTYTVTVTDVNGCINTDQVTITVNPLPDVDAGTDVTICETESVQIGGSPTSTTAGASFAWDNTGSLDDATLANPMASPIVTTTYTVTVTHSNGCTATDQITVNVEPLPDVNFTFANVCLNDLTQFTDISTITSGTIVNWTWDFGDGTGTSTQQNPTYQYATTGTFNVKLIAESASGCRDSVTIAVVINPLPNVDAGIDQVICNLSTATLGGSPTSTTLGVTYAWDNATTLDDPTIANPVANPSVTTTYTVTVTDANGCFDTDQITVTVNPLPVVNFTSSQTCVNEITLFTDISTIASGSNQSWTWDFGDGVGTSMLQNPTYQYTGAGTYAVKLIVESDLGCRDSITQNVIINPIPVVNFSAMSTCFGDMTQFTDLSTIASGTNAGWTWDFGDGVGTSTQQNPSYQFTSAGTFAVKLVVESGFGCRDSLTQNITITPLPDVDAGVDQVICNNGSVVIGGAPTSSVPGVTYAWDNATSLDDPASANPTANPPITTTYTVTVTDVNGCFDTDQVTVTVNPTPTVNFTFSMTCFNDVTQFTDNSTISAGSLQNWTWDFGDGLGTSFIQNPTYQYTSTGTFNVKLVVETALGCLDSITIPVTINPLPTADAGADQTICNTQSVQIGGAPTSTAVGATYLWDNITTLDDATLANPIASPTATTTYIVTVTDANGCTMTDQMTVSVDPLPTVDFSSTQVCQNEMTQFTDLSSAVLPSIVSNWLWDFGDGVGNSTQQNPSYTYLASGTYTVKLIVTTNLGCIDSISRSVIVDTLPTANAGVDRVICEFGTTQIGEPAVLGESYLWDNVASLSSATVADPIASPLVTTTYSVTVTNTNGCTNVDDVVVTVNPAPDVDAGPDVTICETGSAQIGGNPTTSVVGSTFLWNNASTLNDATLANPIASPTDTTEYIVTVTDPNGCTFTDTMVVNVNPLPRVDFRVDAVCEDDFTAFTDISIISVGSIASWSWDFGDGVGTSTLQNPGYQYASDGTYDVKLIVTSSLGCIDSMSRQVIILPMPDADAGLDQTICSGDTIELGGSPTGMMGSTYQWSPGLDLSSATVANPRAYPMSTTRYFLTVTAPSGCLDFDTVDITVNALPVVTAMQDSTLCVDQPVQLSANGASTYSWSPAIYLDDATIANPVATALRDVEYVVSGTDINGCVDTDTVRISVFNVDFLIDAGDTSACLGDTLTLPVIIQGDTTGITYSWTPTTDLSDPTIQNPVVTVNGDQTYVLEIMNVDGCVDRDSARVTLNAAAEVSFEVLNSPRCSGSALEIENTSVNTTDYIWILNGEIRSDVFAPPLLGIDNTVMNTLTLIGSNANCTDTVTQMIDPANLRTLLQLKDANVFTPNGDGINDIYDPGFEGEFIGCVDFQIFDRWGTKVFDSNIGQYGWDGITLRGQLAPTGIYYYIIRIANEEIRGSVYLTR